MQTLATAHSQKPKHRDRGFLQGEGCARYEKLSNFSRVCEEEDLRELAGSYASQDPLKLAADVSGIRYAPPERLAVLQRQVTPPRTRRKADAPSYPLTCSIKGLAEPFRGNTTKAVSAECKQHGKTQGRFWDHLPTPLTPPTKWF